MIDTQAQRGIVFFGHGSRDPLWHKPIEAIAARAAAINSQAHVACAYLELTQPDLPDCVARMVAHGVHRITIVPLFLGVGRHAREDLPVIVAALVNQYPDIKFTLQPAIGEDPRLVNLIASIALSSDEAP